MKRLRLIILALAVTLLAAAPGGAMARGWEPVKTEKVPGQHVASDSEIEIKAGGGVIYVNTTRPVNIKIFTILGSRIAEDNLSAGSYQFAVPTHGVFIVKAGSLTCKVAV